MYTGLLHSHILLRYFVLAMLVVVIVMAFSGLMGKRSFGKWDDKAGLYLLIFTHLQLLVGLLLYFLNLGGYSENRFVIFSSETMSNPGIRYWTVEHVFTMVIVVTLITIARISSKKLPTDQARHKRLLILNAVALVLIIATIVMSGRDLI